MTKALGYAAKHSFSRLKPLEFERPAPKANEVEIDVLYCGVCHSDIHQVENDWGNTVYKELELSFDFILSTIPEKHKVDPFITLLKRNATYCAVGALDTIPGYNNQELIMHRRTLAGSLIGSIKETQDVLDFCAEHNVAPDVQVIDIQDVNDAYKKVKNEDVRFRYVIDMASLKRELEEAA